MVSTEVIILLLCFFFVAISLVGKVGDTFNTASPKLGAKIEKHLETGSAFADATAAFNSPVSWIPPVPPAGGVKK